MKLRILDKLAPRDVLEKSQDQPTRLVMTREEGKY